MLGTTKGFNPWVSPCFSLVDSSILILSYSTQLMMSSFFSLDLLFQPCSDAKEIRQDRCQLRAIRHGSPLPVFAAAYSSGIDCAFICFSFLPRYGYPDGYG